MKGVTGRGQAPQIFWPETAPDWKPKIISFSCHDYSVKHRRTRPISLLCPLTRPVTSTAFAIAAALFLNFFLNILLIHIASSVNLCDLFSGRVTQSVAVCVCSDVTFLTLCASGS